MTDKIDIEAALRASLADHARHAPAAGMLAERIISEVDLVPPARERRWARQWTTWTLPLIAAGSVAAVAAAVVGITQFRHSADHRPPAVPISSSAPAPTPSAKITTPSPAGPTTRVSQSKTAIAPPVPSNFTTLDLTFVSTEEGWALGSGDCLSAPGRCTALVRTTDGARSWQGTTTPPANVAGVDGCADPCVAHLRFANEKIGYAYGPSAFFVTTDGGTSWQHEPGGADALETLDGNVIRVAADDGCSPPGCAYSVRTAPIGSAAWHDVGLSATTTGSSVGVALARTGHRAFLVVFGHTSGGGQDATSNLYTSSDDGANWTTRGEPCPQSAGEVDSIALSGAPDGSASVLCSRRGAGATRGDFTETSTDGGATFHSAARNTLGSGTSSVWTASAAVQFAMSDVLYRSTDGGRSWHRVQQNGQGPGAASFVGFETGTVGRVLEPDAATGAVHTIWTTRDAGLTWAAHTFH